MKHCSDLRLGMLGVAGSPLASLPNPQPTTGSVPPRYAHRRESKLAAWFARLHDERPCARVCPKELELGDPSINIILMKRGEALPKHHDENLITVNVPLTERSNSNGGLFYYEVEGEDVSCPMHVGHAYAHDGSVEHGVEQVKEDERFTLAIHYR